METEQYIECEEPEISLLREWLPRISSEYRAYIKGASQALLYVQEIQGLSTYPCDAVLEKNNSE